MLSSVDLLTDLAAFERLYELTEGRGATVKVKRDELRGLLIDHSAMLNALKSAAVRVNEPKPLHRARPTMARNGL